MVKVFSTCFILHNIFVMYISEVEKGLYKSNTSKATTCSTRKGMWVYETALADNEELGYSLFSGVPFPSLTLIYYHSIDQETNFDQWPLSAPSYELPDKTDWSSWEWRRVEHAEGAWPTLVSPSSSPQGTGTAVQSPSTWSQQGWPETRKHTSDTMQK